jgi:DNA-binding TFAR19-related protein (PDSD5 family)
VAEELRRRRFSLPIAHENKITFNKPAQWHILAFMTKLLEKALAAVRQLPPDSQDEIARAMLNLAAEGEEPEEIDSAHLPDVLEGLAQAKRREFASDAEVEAAFRRFDR